MGPVHLPIGISFFTFQSMSYIIDVYRKEVPAQKNPLTVALYISLFPQLIAGPIVRYRDIAHQLIQRQVKTSRFVEGIYRFVMGLGKKMIIANPLGAVADEIFSVPAAQLPVEVAWLGIICYTLQIYFDFSGYSDMAIGLGRMLGFTFLENFNYPYISRSITEFWRRWHISLSSWFRDYLYIPLGGSRAGAWRTWFNLLVVFVLCGFWHGASWNFLVWGLIHGLFLVIERAWLKAALASWPRVFRHVYVMLVVMFGWVFFRMDTLPEAIGLLGALGGLNEGSISPVYFGRYFDNAILLALFAGGLGSMPIVAWIRKIPMVTAPAAITSSVFSYLWLMSVFILSLAYLGSGTFNPFIYFRF
jgi:alginate O-acetyltransferase complex protein AlgI